MRVGWGLAAVARRGLGSVLLLAACGGGEDLPVATSLEIVAATNNQTAPGGARLPVPLAVVARASGGDPVTRAGVRWSVTQGSGALLSDTLTLADGTGRAEVSLTLGATAGEYRVRAMLGTDQGTAVVLAATAGAPPTLSSVTPTTFVAGDILQLAGSGLAAAAEVFVGGAPAQVLSGTATALSVVAPICLPPGTVDIRAHVSGAPSNAVQGTYQSSLAPVALAVGEYASIDPAQLAGCATFPAAAPAGAEYLVAPQSAASTPGATASFRLQGNEVVVTMTAPPPSPTALPAAVQFHDLLRAAERQASLLPRTAMPYLSTATEAAKTIRVGDRRSFRVCNKAPCSALTDFVTVQGRAEYVGQHAALFVDQSAPAAFTASDYDSLGVMFDRDLYEVDTRAFGAESDVDGNGVVVILFTTAVNQLTAKDECAASIITGYFFGIDIDPLFQSDPRSNRGEVFYALAPDPQGTVTCALSVDLVRRLVPVTFVHEFQHMISYHQHVLVRGGASEVLWLNEALSHVAEELAGLRFEEQGRNDLFSRFAIGNLFNGYLYLDAPGAVFALPSSGTGTLEERGAAWLFIRWLLDQYGPTTSRRLVETGQTGAENVSAAAGAPFARLAAQWFLATYVSDLPNFTAPARLKYVTWRFRTTYQSLHDQLPSRFPKPFPLVPTVFNGGTFSFTGTLRAGSGEYFRVVQGPNQAGFTVRLTDGTGDALPPAVVGRLNVIRIR